MIARDFPPATRTKPLLPWDAFSSTAASAPSLSWSLEPLPPSVSISIFFDPADSWIRALSAPVAFMTMAACPSVPTVMRPSSATVNSATPDAFTTLKGALKLPCCSSSLATRASSAASRLSSAVGPGVPPGCRFCNSSTAFFRLATWSSSCLILSCELLATFCEFFVQRCICPVMAMSSINCGANGRRARGPRVPQSSTPSPVASQHRLPGWPPPPDRVGREREPKDRADPEASGCAWQSRLLKVGEQSLESNFLRGAFACFQLDDRRAGAARLVGCGDPVSACRKNGREVTSRSGLDDRLFSEGFRPACREKRRSRH